MESYLNKKYVLVKHENFEEYLTFTGVGFLAKKVGLSLKPVQILIKNDNGTYTFKFVSTVSSSSFDFKLGEEFEEAKPDGTKVQSIITLEGNKMIHVQKEKNGRTVTHVREFFPDKMIATSTAVGFDKTVMRYYELTE